MTNMELQIKKLSGHISIYDYQIILSDNELSELENEDFNLNLDIDDQGEIIFFDS